MHRTGWWQTSGSSRRGSSGAITERFQIWSVHNIRIETFCQESAAMYVPEDPHIGSVQKDQYPLKFFKKIRSMDSGSRRGYLEKTRPSKSVSKKKKKTATNIPITRHPVSLLFRDFIQNSQDEMPEDGVGPAGCTHTWPEGRAGNWSPRLMVLNR